MAVTPLIVEMSYVDGMRKVVGSRKADGAQSGITNISGVGSGVVTTRYKFNVAVQCLKGRGKDDSCGVD